MAPPSEPSEASLRIERVAGWVLLGGFALLTYAAILYGAGSAGKPVVLAAGLLVTLFGLIAFEEALRDRGERLLPRFGSVTFAIGSTFFIAHDALGESRVGYVFELERVYTLLACVTIGLFGWSILRTNALSSAIGWFAIGWAVVDGILYSERIFQPPLGPNFAILAFGVALVWKTRASGSGAGAPPSPPV